MTTSIRAAVSTALGAVLSNSWLSELPPIPVWPAITFEIDSDPEPGWVIGANYVTHDVNVVILSANADELDALEPLVRNALSSLPSFQYEEGSGDADYEPDPQVYGRFINVRLRTRG